MFALFLLFLLPVARAASAGISFIVTPPEQEYELTGGETRQFVVTISNRAASSLPVTVRVMDIRLDNQGAVELLPPGSTPYSLDRMLTLDRQQLSLAAGSEEEIAVSLKIPHRFSKGHYGAVIVETGAEAAAVATADGKVAVGVRLGTIVMARPAVNRGRKAEISSVAVEKHPVDADGPAFAMTVRNIGEVDLAASSEVVVFDQGKRVVARLPMTSGTGTILPGGEREFNAVWRERRRLEAGSYTAMFRVRYPGGPSLQQETGLVLE